MSHTLRSMASKQKLIAVVTGDVVNSTRLDDRPFLNTALKEAFEATERAEFGMVRSFELYRGDSFQGVIDPVQAIKATLIIRARLRQWKGPVLFSAVRDRLKSNKQLMPIPPGRLPDARISIGIGTMNHLAKKVAESDGEAFVRSGHGLDELVKSSNRLAISTPWDDVNAELDVSVKLLDALVSKWSSGSAQAMFHYLGKETTQSKISDLLDISQPAVHKRLAAAEQVAVQAVIERYEQLVTQKLKR